MSPLDKRSCCTDEPFSLGVPALIGHGEGSASQAALLTSPSQPFPLGWINHVSDVNGQPEAGDMTGGKPF